MTYDKIVQTLNSDPFVAKLFEAPIPMRLAYTGLDGDPRVIPISFIWDGSDFVIATSPDWYKAKAIAKNPNVALTVDSTDFPPLILSARGIARIEYDKGLPPEYIEASRRMVGEDKMEEWERNVRAENRNMALIRIRPTWIKIVDFETRFPGPMPA